MNDKTLSDKTADILVIGTGPVGMACCAAEISLCAPSGLALP